MCAHVCMVVNVQHVRVVMCVVWVCKWMCLGVYGGCVLQHAFAGQRITSGVGPHLPPYYNSLLLFIW